MTDNYKPFLTRLDRIILAVASEWNIPRKTLRSPSRLTDCVVARQMVALLAKEMTKMSNRQIGIKLGNRDHSTITHGAQRASVRISRDPILATKVERLRAKLREELHDDTQRA